MRTIAGTIAIALLCLMPGAAAPDQGERPVWRVAYNDFAPYSFQNTEGEASGFSIELLREVAALRGAELSFITRNNPGDLLAAVAGGFADIVPTLAYTEERAQVLDYSRPIHRIGMFVYVRAEDESRFAGTLPEGARVGVSRGSFPNALANAMEGIAVVPFDSNERVLTALASGEIDAAIYADVAFGRLVRMLQVEDNFTTLGEPLKEIDLSITVTRREPALLQEIEAGLEMVMASARFDALKSRWFGVEEGWTAQGVVRIALMAVGILAALWLGGFIWMRARTRAQLIETMRRSAKEQAEFNRVLKSTNAALDLKNAALDAKNEEMRRILYIVSHDLNSPLVSIAGFARRAERNLAAGKIESATEGLESIGRNVRSMGALIGGILELSRLGQRDLELGAVELGEMVTDIRLGLDSNLEEAGAELVYEGGLGPFRADAAKIRSALQNLVENALRYACREPGGLIEIVTNAGLDTIEIGVRDRGPGIDEVSQRRIFELYQRVETDIPGSGMGLAIVAKIAENHGGRAWVDSAPGKGSTFWMSISRDLVARPPTKELVA